MGLDEVADELYGVAPDGFVARRAELVKQAKADGDKALAAQIGALRRPTAAAWVVNALVRERPDELDRLLDLGEALRSAQAALAGEELRALTKQRQQVVAAMARQARGLARELGHPVSQAVADDVEETLRSALADPDVAAAVRSGRLTASISYAGMGETAPPRLADVVALGPRMDRRAARDAETAARAAGGRTTPTTSTTPTTPTTQEADEQAAREAAARAEAARAAREAELARLTQALREAGAVADRANEDGVTAARALDRARSEHDAARQRVRDLEEQLQAAQAALAGTGDEVGRARKENEVAAKAAAAAARALAVAQEALARATDVEGTSRTDLGDDA